MTTRTNRSSHVADRDTEVARWLTSLRRRLIVTGLLTPPLLMTFTPGGIATAVMAIAAAGRLFRGRSIARGGAWVRATVRRQADERVRIIGTDIVLRSKHLPNRGEVEVMLGQHRALLRSTLRPLRMVGVRREIPTASAPSPAKLLGSRPARDVMPAPEELVGFLLNCLGIDRAADLAGTSVETATIVVAHRPRSAAYEAPVWLTDGTGTAIGVGHLPGALMGLDGLVRTSVVADEGRLKIVVVDDYDVAAVKDDLIRFEREEWALTSSQYRLDIASHAGKWVASAATSKGRRGECVTVIATGAQLTARERLVALAVALDSLGPPNPAPSD